MKSTESLSSRLDKIATELEKILDEIDSITKAIEDMEDERNEQEAILNHHSFKYEF